MRNNAPTLHYFKTPCSLLPAPRSHLRAFFNPRALTAFTLCAMGMLLSVLALATPTISTRKNASPPGRWTFPQAVVSPETEALSLTHRSPLAPDPLSQAQSPGNHAAIAFPSLNAAANQPIGIAPFTASSSIGSATANKQADVSSGELSVGAGAWSIVSSPNTTGALPNLLFGVACVSSSDCWAVGTHVASDYSTLTVHWDGSSWEIVPSPNSSLAKNILQAVTCSSASDCWAVGYSSQRVSSAAEPAQTLILHWDGSAWSVVESANPTGSPVNVLQGVTCASASNCWAVGYFTDLTTGGYYQTLIEHWDGNSWSVALSPNTNSTEDNILRSLACSSNSDCWAVGYSIAYDASTGALSQQLTLIERWDGIAWSIVSSPNVVNTSFDALLGITCASGSDCWAVGNFYNGSNAYETLAEHWDGNSWSVVDSPNVNGAHINNFNSVTYTGASDCWAVGSSTTYDPSTGFQTSTLTEHWDGTSWSIVSSSNIAPGNILFGAQCTSALQCWAVGYSLHYFAHTLIEKYPSTPVQLNTAVSRKVHGNANMATGSWTITPSANGGVGADTNEIFDVTCVSESDCWAVGHFYNNMVSHEQTLIEHWDGSSWSVVESPNPPSILYIVLNSVTCTSASDCWAVGRYAEVGTLTFIIHWDGTSWSIVPSTDMSQINGLEDVSCTSASDCWAVGWFWNQASSTYQSLFEHWNGTSWAIVAAPASTLNRQTPLYGVKCVSASECWAVGFSFDAESNNFETLIQRWDGNSWSIVSSPNTTAPLNELYGVTCASASDCWAAGYSYEDVTGTYRTLIEHWNGTLWTIVATPSTGTPYNFLSSVRCASASECWAAGYSFDSAGSSAQTLLERWDGVSWSIVASPNVSPNANVLNGLTCATAGCWAAGESYDADLGSYRTLFVKYAAPSAPPTTGTIVGTFDINLPLTGSPGIECRSGGANGNHELILTFAAPVTFSSAAVTAGTGSVSGAIVNGNEVKLNLTNVSNAQTLTIDLMNVNDGSNTGNASVSMGVLLGDTSANRLVNSTDVSQTQAQSGQTVTKDNFRTDVSVNGLINSTDVSIVQSKSGTGLP